MILHVHFHKREISVNKIETRWPSFPIDNSQTNSTSLCEKFHSSPRPSVSLHFLSLAELSKLLLPNSKFTLVHLSYFIP